jgi:hypothetical protein
MALMVADVEYEPDELLEEDLDMAALCSCACSPASHDPDAGCQSCVCGARGLRGLAGEDQDEDELEVVVQRILVALKIARKRRIKLGEDRAVRDGRDATRPKVAPKRVTTTKPKATTRAAAPRKAVAPLEAASLPSAIGWERGAWIDQETAVLEELGVGVLG